MDACRQPAQYAAVDSWEAAVILHGPAQSGRVQAPSTGAYKVACCLCSLARALVLQVMA